MPVATTDADADGAMRAQHLLQPRLKQLPVLCACEGIYVDASAGMRVCEEDYGGVERSVGWVWQHPVNRSDADER